MPIAVRELPPYIHVPETKESLDWADLPNIDLSLISTPAGKGQLAKTLINALRTKGFFYVTNFGIAQEVVDRQFAIGKAFYDLPLEEKLKYVPDLDKGEYNGYRPAGRRMLSGGVPDKTEVFNIPKLQHFPLDLPDLIKSHLDEIESFAKSLHDNVLDPLLVLLAVALQLPGNFFTSLHLYSQKSEDHLRYMRYSRFTPDEAALLSDGLWSNGHTDLGSLTLLFRQPVAGLQIKDHETGEWKWVKAMPGSLTVNSCDALSFLTGGYVKSTIHRVSLPPKDQRDIDRLGLLYFARPQNDLVLNTVDSPVLKKEGYTKNEFEQKGVQAPTMGEFTKLKQKWQQSKETTHLSRDGQEILPGFTGRYHA